MNVKRMLREDDACLTCSAMLVALINGVILPAMAMCGVALSMLMVAAILPCVTPALMICTLPMAVPLGIMSAITGGGASTGQVYPI